MQKQKKLLANILLAFVFLSLGYFLGKEFGARGGDGAQTPATAASGPPDGLTVYYFLGDKRCTSCRAIEAQTKTVVHEDYADAVAAGEIRWEVLNREVPENAHFVEKFGLFTQSVVLVEWRGGEIARWSNLQDIWGLWNKEEAFFNYIRKSIQAFQDGEDPSLMVFDEE